MKIHHTITPWRLGQVGDVGYSNAVAPCHIWTLKGVGHGLIATTSPWSHPTDLDRTNAAFIVKAVNAHYDLVNTLTLIRNEIRAYQSPECDDEGNIGAELLKKADEVLKSLGVE